MFASIGLAVRRVTGVARRTALRPIGPPPRHALAVDRGASPVELAIVMPTVLFLLFASIQTAAWFVARATALNAAQSAASAQRAYQAPAGAGEERAELFLNQAGDWLVDWEIDVSVNAANTEVTATVTGEPLQIIPFVSLPAISETAHGTIERLTPAP